MTISDPKRELTMPDWQAKHLSGMLYDLDTIVLKMKIGEEASNIIKFVRVELSKFGPAYSHMIEKILATPAALPVLIGIDDELDSLIEKQQTRSPV